MSIYLYYYKSELIFYILINFPGPPYIRIMVIEGLCAYQHTI
jgi:hypothetical protein